MRFQSVGPPSGFVPASLSLSLVAEASLNKRFVSAATGHYFAFRKWRTRIHLGIGYLKTILRLFWKEYYGRSKQFSSKANLMIPPHHSCAIRRRHNHYDASPKSLHSYLIVFLRSLPLFPSGASGRKFMHQRHVTSMTLSRIPHQTS